jgi:hypothetical protein
MKILLKEVFIVRINNNLTSNNYQMQSANKMLAGAKEKQDQAKEMRAQADKLQRQAQIQERAAEKLKLMSGRDTSTPIVQKQEGVTLEINNPLYRYL